MITCPKCSKDNQDHYKFCLGCGAELPKESPANKPFKGDAGPSPTPAEVAPTPHASGAAMAPTQAVPAQPAGGAPACPQCGHPNAKENRFCASCGFNLATGAQGSVSGPPAGAASGQNAVLTALRADGTEGGTYPLPAEPSVVVGRDVGGIFAGDSYLSPRHASFNRRANALYVKDEGSLNGVYIKLRPNTPWTLSFGDVFRIGQEIIRFEELKPQPKSAEGIERFGSPAKGYIGRLALVIGRDTTGNAFPVPDSGVHCGRERGDILFSEDGYVSGLHCRIARGEGGKVQLTDMGSSNGTFARLKSEQRLVSGDILLMGQQLFRVDL